MMPIGSVKSGVSITYPVGVVDLIPGDGLRYFFFRCSSNMARIGAKLCQNAFQRIPDVSFFDAQKKVFGENSDREFRFSQIWCGFRRATAERTSKSACSSNFALD